MSSSIEAQTDNEMISQKKTLKHSDEFDNQYKGLSTKFGEQQLHTPRIS